MNLAPEPSALLIFFGLGFLILSFFSIKSGLVLMCIAMLFSPEFTIGTIGTKAITLRAEDMLIPMLLMASLARLAVRKEFRSVAASPLNIPILLLIGLSFLSTFRGATTGALSLLPSLFYIFKTIEFFVIFFLVVNYVRTEKQIHLFLYFILITVCLVGLYTLKQVPSVEIFSDKRITAPFEGSPEPATIGGYMVFILLILFSVFLYEQRVGLKWLYALTGLIVFIPFVYTLNRTSYVALFFGLVYIALLEKRKSLVFFLIAIALIAPFIVPSIVKDRIFFTFTDAMNPGRELGVDASFQERIYAYKKMWVFWKHSPLIGWGVASWSLADSQYARTLNEIGIIGLGLWIWIFTRLFRLSRWLFHSLEPGILKGMVLGYRAGLVGIILHGFGAVTLYIVRIMEPFWFISGLVVSLYLLRVEESNTVPP